MSDRPATLVLSGGGAKGAFQVGAESVLRKEFAYRWERVLGVSVGALNATLLAQEAYDTLLEVWRIIGQEDVYKKFGWPTIAFRLAVQKKLGIYDNSPLRKTLKKFAANKPFRIPAFAGRVSLVSGQYESVPHTDPDFLDAVWQSATLPVVWEPIGPQAYVDGGLRNVTPLGDALQHGPSEIVVVLCNPDGIEPSKPPRDIIDVAKRSLTDITINEIMINDVREFERINRLVKQAQDKGFQLVDEQGKPFKYCPMTVIRPARSLGDTLDFSQTAIQARMRDGEEAARGAVKPVLP